MSNNPRDPSSGADQVYEYLESIEEFLSAYIPSPNVLPDIQALAERIFDDLKRFGPPSLPSISLPSLKESVQGLGVFEVPAPPPPPPPPPPLPWHKAALVWSQQNKWVIIGGFGGVVVGAGLLVGYRAWTVRAARLAQAAAAARGRREVVVVLGADMPCGPALVHALEKKGYVVIASVATPEEVDRIERKSKGFVKALVLDPKEPASATFFLRSLQSALSLRYPLNTPGDPYLPPTALHTNVLISTISLLSLASPTPPQPLERLPLANALLPHLYTTLFTPLNVLQAMLPLIRVATHKAGARQCSILVLVPAMASRVGVPFMGAEAIAAGASVKGAEVLRRELKAVGEKDINVVIVDVGVLSTSEASTGASVTTTPATQLMTDWSTGERATYGEAFAASLGARLAAADRSGTPRRGRKPTEVDTLITAIVGVVSRGKQPLGWTALKNWWRGDRFAVGAGAHTYTLASFLPPRVLDFFLTLPSYIAALGERLAPDSTPPPKRPPPPPPPALPKQKLLTAAPGSDASGSVGDESESISSIPTDFDLDSHEGEGRPSELMGESWISLQDGTHAQDL